MIVHQDALRTQPDAPPNIQMAPKCRTTPSELSSRVPPLLAPDLGHNLFYNLKVLVASLLSYLNTGFSQAHQAKTPP